VKIVAQEPERRAAEQQREQRGGITMEAGADDAERRERDHGDAARDSVHAIDEVERVGDRDEPQHGERGAQHRTEDDRIQERHRDARHAEPGGEGAARDEQLTGELEPGPHRVQVVVDSPEMHRHRAADEREQRRIEADALRTAQNQQRGEREGAREHDRDPADARHRIGMDLSLVGLIEQPEASRVVTHQSCEQQRRRAREEKSDYHESDKSLQWRSLPVGGHAWREAVLKVDGCSQFRKCHLG
jgi:hypothetical protein